MWPVLVQLLPNVVEKTMLEDTRFFPHDGESRGGWGGRGGTLWPFPVERDGGSIPWGCLHTEQGLEWGAVKHMVTGTSQVLIFVRENKFIC